MSEVYTPTTPFARAIWNWRGPGTLSDAHAESILAHYAYINPTFSRLMGYARGATRIHIAAYATPGSVCVITAAPGAFCRDVTIHTRATGSTRMPIERLHALALWGLVVFSLRGGNDDGSVFMGPDPSVHPRAKYMLWAAASAIDKVASSCGTGATPTQTSTSQAE